MTTNRSGFRPLAATLLALLLLSSLAIGQQGTVENPAFARGYPYKGHRKGGAAFTGLSLFLHGVDRKI